MAMIEGACNQSCHRFQEVVEDIYAGREIFLYDVDRVPCPRSNAEVLNLLFIMSLADKYSSMMLIEFHAQELMQKS